MPTLNWIGKDAVILDSFAGSGTTARAVLKQNAEDAGTKVISAATRLGAATLQRAGIVFKQTPYAIEV